MVTKPVSYSRQNPRIPKTVLDNFQRQSSRWGREDRFHGGCRWVGSLWMVHVQHDMLTVISYGYGSCWQLWCWYQFGCFVMVRVVWWLTMPLELVFEKDLGTGSRFIWLGTSSFKHQALQGNFKSPKNEVTKKMHNSFQKTRTSLGDTNDTYSMIFLEELAWIFSQNKGRTSEKRKSWACEDWPNKDQTHYLCFQHSQFFLNFLFQSKSNSVTSGGIPRVSPTTVTHQTLR